MLVPPIQHYKLVLCCHATNEYVSADKQARWNAYKYTRAIKTNLYNYIHNTLWYTQQQMRRNSYVFVCACAFGRVHLSVSPFISCQCSLLPLPASVRFELQLSKKKNTKKIQSLQVANETNVRTLNMYVHLEYRV